MTASYTRRGRLSPFVDSGPARCACGHDWDEHDGMGDCHHPDKRTLTGFCAGHERSDARDG